jgi:peptide subunit release factor RF-3
LAISLSYITPRPTPSGRFGCTRSSGMNNFGVELFLQSFLGYAETPRSLKSEGETVEPTDDDFSGKKI